MGWMTGFKSLAGAGKGFFSLYLNFQTGSEVPSASCLDWVPGALSLGIQWLRHEAHLSPPSNAKFNVWSHTLLPIHLCGLLLN
jgi:hypothetical protein